MFHPYLSNHAFYHDFTIQQYHSSTMKIDYIQIDKLKFQGDNDER